MKNSMPTLEKSVYLYYKQKIIQMRECLTCDTKSYKNPLEGFTGFSPSWFEKSLPEEIENYTLADKNML